MMLESFILSVGSLQNVSMTNEAKSPRLREEEQPSLMFGTSWIAADI